MSCKIILRNKNQEEFIIEHNNNTGTKLISTKDFQYSKNNLVELLQTIANGAVKQFFIELKLSNYSS